MPVNATQTPVEATDFFLTAAFNLLDHQKVEKLHNNLKTTHIPHITGLLRRVGHVMGLKMLVVNHNILR